MAADYYDTFSKRELRKIYDKWAREEIEAIEVLEAVQRYLYPKLPLKRLPGGEIVPNDE